jgi:diguanylate cyclase (GGDEF)-like protein
MAGPAERAPERASESKTAEDLRRSFAGRLPTRLAEVEAARDAARDAGWAGEPLRTFHRLAHSLAGVGATFGFPEVTELARRLESLLKTALAEGKPPADGEVGGLLAGLREIAGRPLEPAVAAEPERTAAPAGDERLLFLGSDDPGLRDSLTLQLRPFGYEVQAFADLEALEREVEREPPAAVLLDWEGSGDGADARRLATLGRTPGPAPKRVFLSARGDLAARLEVVRAGGDAYLTKPVEAGLLAETLDRLTGGGPADPYRVLIVEDDADLADLYAEALEAEGMRATVVSDPMSVMAPLTRFQPDLILMDLYMPGCTGPELAAVLRQQEGYIGTPIVYLSTEEGVEQQIAAINAGGDEFLTKPIAPGYLVAAVEARTRRGRLLATRIAYDGLTGLLNHSHLKQQIEIELAQAGRERWQVSYAMIDIDRFKAINDTFGHAGGDRLLKSLARLLRQRLRRSDVLGRYGGDELAVLFPHTDGPTARRVLDEIRDSFSRLRLTAGDREMTATLSCGVAVYPASPSAQELIEAADAALYEAKGGGRNRVVLRE